MVVCSVFVWCTHDGMIFEKYGNWLSKKEFEGKWWAKPLGGCSFCFTGQVSFWTGLVLFGLSYEVVLFACFAMFFDRIKSKVL